MQFPASLISLLTLSLTTGGSRQVKEIIIDKPAREVVIGQQLPQPLACIEGNTTYSSSSLSGRPARPSPPDRSAFRPFFPRLFPTAMSRPGHLRPPDS